MAVKFVRPNVNLIRVIANNMRDQDVAEVWASSHQTPMEALMTGWNDSEYSVVITVNKKPAAMVGILRRDVLSGIGIVWVLGTDEIVRYKKQFLIHSKAVINELLTLSPKLYNYVHVKNTVSVEWLRRTGFTLEPEEPFGPDNEMFQKFYIERKTDV